MDFHQHHGRKAGMIIGSVVLAVVVILPVLNRLFGSFLPQRTLTV